MRLNPLVKAILLIVSRWVPEEVQFGFEPFQPPEASHFLAFITDQKSVTDPLAEILAGLALSGVTKNAVVTLHDLFVGPVKVPSDKHV